MSTRLFGTAPSLSRSVFLWYLWLLITWTLAIFLKGFLAKLMTLLLLVVFTAPIELLALVLGVVAWARWKARPRRWLALGGLLCCPLLATTMLVTQWPMKLSFALSKPALDRLADAVETRPVSEDTNGLTVCLWMLPLERHHVGFVRGPVGVTPEFNPWTHSGMDAHWHYFGED